MGCVLSSPVELVRVQRHGNQNFRCAVAEMQGWRMSHEDAHEIRCKGSSAALWVLDGHGGDGAALYSAPELAKEFEPELAAGAALPPDSRLEKGFVDVDRRLSDYLTANPEKESGSTVIGALCSQEGGAYAVKLMNCGDSRAIVVRGPDEEESSAQTAKVRRPRHVEALDAESGGRGDEVNGCRWPLIVETVDHKPNLAIEKARIEAAGGSVTEEEPPRLDGNLAVSRGMGDFEYKSDPLRPSAEQKVSSTPDIYEVSDLRRGTILVLACDGVWDVMSGDSLGTFVRGKLSSDPDFDLGELCTEVIGMCLKRNSRDNITCMIVQLSDGSDWTSVADEMKGYEKLVDRQENFDEDVRTQYNKFLSRCKFPPEPCICKLCRKWTNDMSQCPCKQVNYCSRHCQKKDWKSHKLVCSSCTTQQGAAAKT